MQTKITFRCKDVPIQEVLKTLEATYKVKFTYLNSEVPLSKRVTLNIIQLPLDKALDLVFKEVPLSYQEIGSQILLRKKTTVTTDSVAPAPTSTLSPIVPRPQRDSSLPARTAVRNRKRGLGTFFSFLPRKKGTLHKVYEIAPPLDSAALAKDSLERKKKEARRKKNPTTTDLGQRHTWRLGILYAYQGTYRSLSGNEKKMAERNAIESRSAGYTWGITLDYQWHAHLYIRTGLMAMNFKEKGLQTLVKQFIPPPHKRGKDFQDDTSIAYTNQYRFLAIPFLVGYRIGDTWFGSGYLGFAPTIFLGTRTSYPEKNSAAVSYPADYAPNPAVKPPPPKASVDTYYYYKEALDIRNRAYNTLGCMFLIGIEGGYRFKEHFMFSVSPVFRKFLTTIQAKEAKVKEKPYAYGISLQLYYAF